MFPLDLVLAYFLYYSVPFSLDKKQIFIKLIERNVNCYVTPLHAIQFPSDNINMSHISYY